MPNRMNRRVILVLLVFALLATTALHQAQTDPVDVRVLAWAPDGIRIATGDLAGKIRIWDTVDSSLLLTIQAHDGPVLALAWNSDGIYLASSGADRTMRIWSVTDGSLIADKDHPQFPATSMTWHPNLTQVFFGGAEIDVPNQLGLWDTISNSVTYEGRVELGGLLISPDNKYLIYLTNRSPSLRPLADLSQVVVLGLPDDQDKLFQGSSLAVSADARTLAVGYINGWIRLWDIETQAILAEYEATLDHPTCCNSFNWNVQTTHLFESTLTAVVTNGSMRVWDIDTNKLISDVQIGEFFRGGFSPYGARLAKLHPGEATLITGIQILVPDPSLERLNGIAEACVPETATRDPFVADSLAEVGAFVERINALPGDAIPPACRADLLAVAEALLAETRE